MKQPGLADPRKDALNLAAPRTTFLPRQGTSYLFQVSAPTPGAVILPEDNVCSLAGAAQGW